jgi:DNA-binding transcriptional ArsR family regulator
VAIGLSAPAVARIRIGVSCLWEVLASVRVLRDPGVPEVHRRWAERVRLAPGLPGPLTPGLFGPPTPSLLGPPTPGLVRPSTPGPAKPSTPGPAKPSALLGLSTPSLLGHLVAPTGGYTPDFLTPPPSGLAADLDRELAGLRATPPDLVRAHLDLMPGQRPSTVQDLYADPQTGLDRLAVEIAAYWQAAIAPEWPRMQELLGAEVQRQARRLAEDGSGTILNDLHPAVTWTDGRLEVDQRHCVAPDVPNAAGLVLIPSVFVWPSVMTVSSGDVAQLAYPARGVATLWERSSRPPDALGAIIGRGRARLLFELGGAPLSTTELARRTGLSAGGVSQHLSALRAAGLIVTHRQGRAVLNSRTPVADALLTAAGRSSSTHPTI